jgi:hypothetical protein
VQEALLAYLTGAGSGLPALVGTRIAWGMNDQGAALPRVSLFRADSVPEYADDGEANLFVSRVQVDCYATTYASAQALGRAVRARVSAVVVTQGATDFQSIYIEDEQDTVETYDGGRNVFRVRIDLMVWHKEL